MRCALAILIIVTIFGCGRQETFRHYPKGLMYNDTVMNRLQHIADSLQTECGKSTPYKTYYSRYQAKGHYVYLYGKDAMMLHADIARGISFEDFCRKYGDSMAERDVLVVSAREINTRHRWVCENAPPEIVTDTDFSLNIVFPDDYQRGSLSGQKEDLLTTDIRGQWKMEFWPKDEDREGMIYAIFFTENFSNKPIPAHYAGMIRYADCMIDTVTNVQLYERVRSFRTIGDPLPRDDSEKGGPEIEKLMQFIDIETGKPDMGKMGRSNAYYDSAYKWLSIRDSVLEAKQGHSLQLRTMVKNAVEEALAIKKSNEQLEMLAEKYDSKEHALALRRSRIIMGGCSRDGRPRMHEEAIARLAAELGNWNVFIRAHLNLTNDYFMRVADAGAAERKRETYIKELEALGMDIVSLMMGTVYATQNPSGNHYYGSVSRTGRAMSECEHRAEFEQQVYNGVCDSALDDFNRLRMYHLYSSYIFNLTDKNEKQKNITKLKAACKTLPTYLASRINIEDYTFDPYSQI